MADKIGTGECGEILIYQTENGQTNIQINNTEICKLYVDTCFQGQRIGHKMIQYAVGELGADHLWALEKNTRAISFYNKNGFNLTGHREFEDGTAEYIVELRR